MPESSEKHRPVSGSDITSQWKLRGATHGIVDGQHSSLAPLRRPGHAPRISRIGPLS